LQEQPARQPVAAEAPGGLRKSEIIGTPDYLLLVDGAMLSLEDDGAMPSFELPEALLTEFAINIPPLS
jgi:hypothetical protein